MEDEPETRPKRSRQPSQKVISTQSPVQQASKKRSRATTTKKPKKHSRTTATQVEVSTTSPPQSTQPLFLPLSDSSEPEPDLPAIQEFIDCSIKAEKPRGGIFHEDNIQWLQGCFRWQQIEDFLEEVAQINVYKTEYLKLQNVYGYFNKRP